LVSGTGQDKSSWRLTFWAARGCIGLVAIGCCIGIIVVAARAARRSIDVCALKDAWVLKQQVEQRFRRILTAEGGWTRLKELTRPLQGEVQRLRKIQTVQAVVVLDLAGEVVADYGETNREGLRGLADKFGVLLGESEVQIMKLKGQKTTRAAVMGFPLRRSGRTVGGVMLAQDRSHEVAEIARITRRVALISVLVVVAMNGLGVALGIGVARHLERRLRTLGKEQRTETVKELAGMLAHEIRNSLNGLSLACQLQRRAVSRSVSADAAKAELESGLNVMDAELKHISRALDSLVGYADRLAPEYSDHVDLRRVVQSSLDIFATQLQERSIEVKAELGESVHARVDADMITQVLRNVVQNAIDAMPQGGTLTVTLRRKERAAHIVVSDTGCGISPASLEHVLEPYFSTKPEGLGLGLAICKKIVDAHGGAIDAFSEPGKGSMFVIRLPLKDAGQSDVS